MKMITTLAAGAAMAFTAIPFASPAMAQGGLTKMPLPEYSSCPKSWDKIKRSPDPNYACYPNKNSRPAYPRQGSEKCADGYEAHYTFCEVKEDKASSASSSSSSSSFQGSAADRLVSYGTITKANPLDRCPLGYFSKSDMTICTTTLSPAPKSRRKDGACNSNEIDEWGLYCTADANVITRKQAEVEATRDFNAIYTANGANYPAQGNDTENYPSMVAAYGPKGGAQAAASTSSSQSSGDEPAAQQTAQCTTDSGSATGAVVGAAVGGEAGAALGGMLGGLGKKKKKKGC
jgi:hypothetical protein